MMLKRKLKFHSHISNVKQHRRETVSELVEGCYVKEIIEQIDGKAAIKCNSCRCSFKDLMECYFIEVLIDLESDASGVIVKFEEVVKDCNNGYYKPEEVLNAKKMLECEVHRKLLAVKNHQYFYEAVLAFKM